MCYKTFVRPVLEYGYCVWVPHQETHILDIEKIQKRAARFVTGNHTEHMVVGLQSGIWLFWNGPPLQGVELRLIS